MTQGPVRRLVVALVSVVVMVALARSEMGYALAAIAGSSLLGQRQQSLSRAQAIRAFRVRATLIAADGVAAMTGLAATLFVTGQIWGLSGYGGGQLLTLVLIPMAWPLAAVATGMHPGYGLSRSTLVTRGTMAVVAAAVMVAAAAQALGDAFPIPYVAALLALPVAASLAPLTRAAATRWLQHTHQWSRPVVVIGDGPSVSMATRNLRRQRNLGLEPVAYFGNEFTSGELPLSHGPIADAWEFIREHGIQHVVVCPDSSNGVDYDTVLRHASHQVRHVRVIGGAATQTTATVCDTPQLPLDAGTEHLNHLASVPQRVLKRLMDVIGASVLLLMLSPLLLVLTAAVKLDSRGPALYLSPRLGRGGRPFSCIKFRSMHVDAEARLMEVLNADAASREEYERYHKLENDPRMTRLGTLLRRASLDELPQLFNVLAGHMSLVGPRPYLVRELPDMASAASDLIFLSRPGMTGYWQVDGRTTVTFEGRQHMEADYVRRWSLWWDVSILLRTPKVVVSRNGR